MSEAKKTAKKSAPAKKAATKKGAPAKKSAASSKSAAKSAPKRAPAKSVGKAAPAKSTGAKLTKKTRTSLPPPAPSGVAIRRAESKKLALELVAAALEKKAERIEVIDVADRVDYADYVVLLSGRSDVQLGAIAQAVEDAVKKHGKHPRADGRRGAAWIVLDCDDVWVHVFMDEARKYYDIEGLWMDAPRVDLPKDTRPKSTGILEPEDDDADR